MKLRSPLALFAAAALAGCGMDATPQSSGSAGATNPPAAAVGQPAPVAPPADKAGAQEESKTEGEKKQDDQK